MDDDQGFRRSSASNRRRFDASAKPPGGTTARRIATDSAQSARRRVRLAGWLAAAALVLVPALAGPAALTAPAAAAEVPGPAAVADPATASATSTPGFVPLSPTRLMDTRPGQSTVDGAAAGTGKVLAGTGNVHALAVLGRGGIPSTGVAAVVLNVTATEASAGTYVTVFPSGESPPTASNLNVTVGQTVPNLVVVKLGTDGRVAFFNAVGGIHLVADVAGWFPVGSNSFTPLSPTRLLDTRAGRPTADHLFEGVGAVTADSPLILSVRGRAGIPGTVGLAGAVILNVTAVDATAPSYVTVFPWGEQRPTASNLNFLPGAIVPNLVVAKLGTDGKIVLANGSGSTHLIADVVGWFAAATPDFTPLSPGRLLDSRAGQPTVDGLASGVGALGAGSSGQPGSKVGSYALTVAGRAGVPASGVGAVVLNVTATENTAASFVTVHPHGRARPGASNLNFPAGLTIANLVVARVGSDGRVVLYNEVGSVHLVVDVVGWFPTVASTGPVRAWGCPEFAYDECTTGGSNPVATPIDPSPVAVEGFAGGSAVTAVSSGLHHTLALHADGSVVAWGDNAYGQLGSGSTYSSAVPVAVRGLGPGSDVVAVAAGGWYSLALKLDGTVFAWGDNSLGQLGRVQASFRSIPAPVPGLGGSSGVTRINAGTYHPMALTGFGGLMTWGFGAGPAVFMTGVRDMATGFNHGLILATDGRVLAWGSNQWGQLGQGNLDTPTTEFAPVVGLGAGSTVTSVFAGAGTSYAIKADGTVLGWGSNFNNQVGFNGAAPTTVNVPTQIAGFGPGTGVATLAVGWNHVLALKGDGSVFGWGANSRGQLGTGTTSAPSYPTVLPGYGPGSGTTAVAAGLDHSIAVTG